MEKQISVSIPEPCKEKWSSFTPTATGGFCGSCQKNVIDFTHATADEIVAFIRQKPEHACGRFRKHQLKTYSLLPPATLKPGFMLVKAGAVSLLLLLVSKPAFTQNKKASAQQYTTSQSITTSTNASASSITVKGTVKSAAEGSLLQGVSVVHRGTLVNTITDENGNFELTIDTRSGRTITFSFIGSRWQEVEITYDNPRLNIMMEDDVTTLGEIVMTGAIAVDQPYAERPGFLKRVWLKIKSFF